MNILEFYKVNNIYDYTVGNEKLDKNTRNYGILKEIIDFSKICYEMDNIDFEKTYKWFSNAFLDDIEDFIQREETITFDLERILEKDSFYNENAKYYFDLLKKYINEDFINNTKKEITIVKYYYLLSDLTEVYGISKLRSIFNDSKTKTLR